MPIIFIIYINGCSQIVPTKIEANPIDLFSIINVLGIKFLYIYIYIFFFCHLHIGSSLLVQSNINLTPIDFYFLKMRCTLGITFTIGNEHIMHICFFTICIMDAHYAT